MATRELSCKLNPMPNTLSFYLWHVKFTFLEVLPLIWNDRHAFLLVPSGHAFPRSSSLRTNAPI